MKLVIARNMAVCSLNLPLRHSLFNYDDYEIQSNTYSQENKQQIFFCPNFILFENVSESFAYPTEFARKNKRIKSVVVVYLTPWYISDDVRASTKMWPFWCSLWVLFLPV